MTPFDQAWDVLKATTSYRMNPESTYSMHNMPTEVDFGAVEQHLVENPDSNLGDLLQPYLTGQFSPAAPESEEGVDEEKGRSFQQTATGQRVQGERGRREVDAPFPLSEEEAQQHLSFMQGDGYWDMPGEQTRGQRYESHKKGAHPSRQLLSNALRVLQGRMRQAPNIRFEPERTESSGRGVNNTSHALRQSMYANTPLSVVPKTTHSQRVGRVGVAI